MFNVTYQAGGRLDPPFMPTKTQPYVKGINVQVADSQTVVTKDTSFDFPTELISISVGASDYDPDDCWDIIVDGVMVMESIFCKELPEGTYLMVAKPIPAGTVIRFVYHNNSNNGKKVWVNYQLLRDPVTA